MQRLRLGGPDKPPDLPNGEKKGHSRGNFPRQKVDLAGDKNRGQEQRGLLWRRSTAERKTPRGRGLLHQLCSRKQATHKEKRPREVGGTCCWQAKRYAMRKNKATRRQNKGPKSQSLIALTIGSRWGQAHRRLDPNKEEERIPRNKASLKTWALLSITSIRTVSRGI